MRTLFLLIATFLAITETGCADFIPATSWSNAKNQLDDHVYNDHRFTFYCGCVYTSDNDSDGSGDIDADACGLPSTLKKPNIRDTIQWEHVVPASLMPVGNYMCWQKEDEVSACKNASGTVTKKNRECCEVVSPSGRLMIFDLYNLTPAAAQLNQYRSNDPYGEVADGSGYEGFGDSCTARDLNSTQSGPEGLFEPPDCKKGDVARIWFYMRLAHGVQIDAATNALFLQWSAMDPVSPWESERSRRIAGIQGNVNPYVDGIQPDAAGSCPWEP